MGVREQELRSLGELLTWKLAVDRKLLKPAKGSSRPADRATTGSIWCRGRSARALGGEKFGDPHENAVLTTHAEGELGAISTFPRFVGYFQENPFFTHLLVSSIHSNHE